MKRRIAALSLSLASILCLATAGVALAGAPQDPRPALVLQPTITGSFSAGEVLTGATVSAKFSIANPNAATVLTTVGVAVYFNVAIPVFSPKTVCGGTLTHTGGNLASLAGATIAAASSCAFAIDVVGTSPISLQFVTASLTANGALAPSTATGATQVVDQPTIQTSFTPTSVATGAKSTLKITLTNPSTNSVAVGQAGATITLPSGLAVINGTSSAGTCGGTLKTFAPSLITISGSTIPKSGSCTTAVFVTGTASGLKSIAAKVHMDFGAGTNASTAGLTVVDPTPAPTPAPTAAETAPTPAPSDTPVATVSESPVASASATAGVVAAASSNASASPSLAALPTTPTSGGGDGAVLLLLGILIGAVLALGSAAVAVLFVRRRPVPVVVAAAEVATPGPTEPPATN